jgi:hypothetical protein
MEAVCSPKRRSLRKVNSVTTHKTFTHIQVGSYRKRLLLIPNKSRCFSAGVELICSEGRAIAQAVSCRLPTAAARVRARIKSFGICFPFQFSFYQMLHSHLSSGARTIGQLVADVRIFSSPRRSDRLWAHPASYPMGTGGSFPGGKAAGAWS